MTELRNALESYLQLDKDPKTREELQSLPDDELKQRLGSRLAFGTAGLRAKLGAGYSRMNELTVIQATQGIYAYLQGQSTEMSSIVIGRDHRQ
jgi:phosphoglucomutase